MAAYQGKASKKSNGGGGSEHPKSSKPADCGARAAWSKAQVPSSVKGADAKTPYKHREYSG